MKRRIAKRFGSGSATIADIVKMCPNVHDTYFEIQCKDELGFCCVFETRVRKLGASLDSCSQRSLAYKFPVMARLFSRGGNLH